MIFPQRPLVNFIQPSAINLSSSSGSSVTEACCAVVGLIWGILQLSQICTEKLTELSHRSYTHTTYQAARALNPSSYETDREPGFLEIRDLMCFEVRVAVA